jgi:toxin YoeB
MIVSFDKNGLEDYIYWQTQDRKTLKKINQLLSDIVRSPFSGIGKPEPLKEDLSGCWSRRIDDKNRLVYSVNTDSILVYSCKSHYE